MKTYSVQQEHAPNSIWRYYQTCAESLVRYQNEIMARPGVAQQYREYTVSEILDEFEGFRAELENEVTMALVASFEAIVRHDFLLWVCRKKRGGIRTIFVELNRRFEGNVPLDEILDGWKAEIGQGQAIGRFKQLVRFRHWLAHGRGWIQKSGIDPDPSMAWRIADRLFSVIPGLEGSLV
jgi:hypothetical protein